jgi:hypothetical protein
MVDYYFLMCLLPPLPAALGDKMPLPFAEITGMIKRHIHPGGHYDLLCAHLLVVDTANWEQMDLERDLFMEGGLLSREEMTSHRDLPDFIRSFQEERERGIHLPYIYDRLWEIYYRYAHTVATHSLCRFLIDYLSWEIELRASLAALRARDEGVNPEEHAILGSFQSYDFSNLIAQFKSQKNPLLAERYLDEERLKQIYHCEGSSPFSLDALLAYLSRSMIYSRWEKISEPVDIENYLWHGGSM